MRSLTALAVILGAAALSASPAMAQTATDPAAGAQEQTIPGTTDPAAGAQQQMPGAAGTDQPTMDTTATDAGAAPAIMSQQQGDHHMADDYIGAKVVARSDDGLEDIGEVSDLVLGPDDKIVGVVVDVGGFLGVGAKPVGLSWASLTQERADGELLLKTELTRQALEEAPEFQSLDDQQGGGGMMPAPATGTSQ